MFVKFRVEPSGMSFDLKVVVPVVIGTIPLRSTFSQFRSTPNPTITPISPTAPLPPTDQDLPPSFSDSKDIPATDPFSAYPDLPPPSYEEAQGLPSMRMEDDNEHTMGNWDYKPIYPYYG